MIQPHNFPYAITFFTICIIGGMTLLLNNKRNKLLLINALLFFLCASRFCTEYYIQQLDDFAIVSKIVDFHRIVGILIGTCVWTITWFYIRPFKDKKWEYWANQVYLWLLIILPIPLIAFAFAGNYNFELIPYKIDGLWKYQMKTGNIISQLGHIYSLVLMGGITLFAMITEMIRNPKNRFQKIIAALCFLFLPILIQQTMSSTNLEPYKVSSQGIVFLSLALSVTWFVSDYRIFFNSFQKTIKDLLDSISDLAIFTDTNFKITHINRSAELVFRQSLIGHQMTDVLRTYSEQSSEAVETLVIKLNQDKQLIEEIKLTIGTEIRTFFFKSAIFEQGNLHLGYTFLLTDITEIREKEQQLEEVNATKDQLFAIIGHDLRKPALAFRGITKKVNYLIQQREFEVLNQLGETLEQSALNLNKLLDNLLKWALSQKDALKINAKPHAIQPIIEEILHLFAQIIVDKQLKFELRIAPNTKVLGDKEAISTIIRNLIDNSIKFTPTGKKIQLLVETTNQQVLLQLQDSGVGMTATQVEKIFQLRSDKIKQGTQGEKGAGLGMVLVRELVALQQGQIKVSSQLKEGTLIELMLPAA